MPEITLFDEPCDLWRVLVRSEPHRVVRFLASVNATAHCHGEQLFNVCPVFSENILEYLTTIFG